MKISFIHHSLINFSPDAALFMYIQTQSIDLTVLFLSPFCCIFSEENPGKTTVQPLILSVLLYVLHLMTLLTPNLELHEHVNICLQWHILQQFHRFSEKVTFS